MKKEVKGSNQADPGESQYPSEEVHMNEGEEETETQAGCVTASFLFTICVLTLLVILFSAALIYRDF